MPMILRREALDNISGAELDLLLMAQGRRFGFEFKYSDAPGQSRSMLVALEDLKLDHLCIVYPGEQEYFVDEKITSCPLSAIAGLPSKLSRKKAKENLKMAAVLSA